MKKMIYAVLFVLLAFTGCGNEDENKEARRMYLDISDFTMYKGAPGGAVQVQFNTLKKKELVNKYLSKVYSPNEYAYNTIQFNGDKLRYVKSSDGRTGNQIISTYEYIEDSLFIHILNAATQKNALEFVALVDDNNNLYRQKGLCRYPYPQKEDTIRSLDQKLDLATMLDLSGYNSLQDMTDQKDTIIWCNVRYLFY